MEKILFVCTANVCRSPMAAAIFNALAEDRGLSHRAESAGVAALTDQPLDRYASAALEEIGIPTESHHARQVSREMIEEADLVLAMNPQHVRRLRRAFGDSLEASTLPEYLGAASGDDGISDPHGNTMVAYRASARQLLEYLDLLVGRLER